MVKTLKNLLLQNQESCKAESCYRALGLKVIQVCSNDDPRLTFDLCMAWSNLHPYAFVWGSIENSFSENVLKTAGWNLQCMIKVANPFSFNHNFVLQGYLPLPLGYIHVWNLIIFEHLLLLNSLTNFHQISHWTFCWRHIINLHY